jgi:hypothetical protein
VGITRAMRTLNLSWAFERAKYGRRARAVPSRFFFEAQGEEPPDGWQGIEKTIEPEKEESRLPHGKRKAGRATAAGRAKTGASRKTSTCKPTRHGPRAR